MTEPDQGSLEVRMGFVCQSRRCFPGLSLLAGLVAEPGDSNPGHLLVVGGAAYLSWVTCHGNRTYLSISSHSESVCPCAGAGLDVGVVYRLCTAPAPPTLRDLMRGGVGVQVN